MWKTARIPSGPRQAFRHEELRSSTCIRLVQVHAKLFHGCISCTLQHFESDPRTCPEYAALSYVWYDSTPRETIYINGLVYKVHWSLWVFLNHRRTTRETKHKWIWTDLLGIDQAHHSEKNEQISRMGDIYTQAACVISWLGDDERTQKALKTLVKFSRNIYKVYAPKYGKKSPQALQIQSACHFLSFREPYWGRVWVMQEVACARHCIVASGDFSLKIGDLLHMMEMAMDRSSFFDDVSIRAPRIGRIKALVDLNSTIQHGKPMKFLELIEKTEFCEATRDQDRIYGLLGLASRLDPGFDSRALEVSQHKSLNDVWWDMIFIILDGETNISIKSDLAVLQNQRLSLKPPYKHCILEMGSSIRRSCAETASWASEAAYSRSIQNFLGIRDSFSRQGIPDVPWADRFAVSMSRRELRRAWKRVTAHVSNHEHDVPGLQTRLGWSAYAGLRFTTWHCFETKILQKLEHSLPLGWVCAAHWPDPLQKTTAKHPITDTYSIDTRPERRSRSACYCSGAEHDGPRCDMSLVLLRIEPLSVTCLVRSANTVQIDFYCDCCDPSAASAELPLLGSFLPTLTANVDAKEVLTEFSEEDTSQYDIDIASDSESASDS